MLEKKSSASQAHSMIDIDQLSKKSIRKVVRNESLLHPLTIYPTAFAMLSGMAALLYDLPILFLGMGSLLAVGATTSIVNFFFRDESISMQYLEKVTHELKKRQEYVRRTLADDLQACSMIIGSEQYGIQGLKQFSKIEKKYKKIVQLLKKRFNITELTYGSYLGAAEQLHLSMLDNLMKIVSLLQSAESIDPNYISQRKRELNSLKKVTQADERELEALKRRIELRNSQLDQVNNLLTENEESMTIMDSTIAAIADLETGTKLADNDLKTAMEYLQEIADRTKYYQKK